MLHKNLSLIVDNSVVSLSHHAANKLIVDISNCWCHKVFDVVDIIKLLSFIPQGAWEFVRKVYDFAPYFADCDSKMKYIW